MKSKRIKKSLNKLAEYTFDNKKIFILLCLLYCVLTIENVKASDGFFDYNERTWKIGFSASSALLIPRNETDKFNTSLGLDVRLFLDITQYYSIGIAGAVTFNPCDEDYFVLKDSVTSYMKFYNKIYPFAFLSTEIRPYISFSVGLMNLFGREGTGTYTDKLHCDSSNCWGNTEEDTIEKISFDGFALEGGLGIRIYVLNIEMNYIKMFWYEKLNNEFIMPKVDYLYIVFGIDLAF